MKDIPIQIAVEEAKKEIINDINEISNKYNLSYFLLNIIMNDIHEEVSIKEKEEFNVLRKQYNKNKEVKKDGKDTI
mgnify:FL=1